MRNATEHKNDHALLKEIRLNGKPREDILNLIDELLGEDYGSLKNLRSEVEKGEGLGLNGTPYKLMNLYDAIYQYQNGAVKEARNDN